MQVSNKSYASLFSKLHSHFFPGKSGFCIWALCTPRLWEMKKKIVKRKKCDIFDPATLFTTTNKFKVTSAFKRRKSHKMHVLCYELSPNISPVHTKNNRNAVLHESVLVQKLIKYPIILLHSIFWKRTIFQRSSQFGHFGPKCASGSQNHVEEGSKVCQENWRFAKKLCEPTLSQLFPASEVFSSQHREKKHKNFMGYRTGRFYTVGSEGFKQMH